MNHLQKYVAKALEDDIIKPYLKSKGLSNELINSVIVTIK